MLAPQSGALRFVAIPAGSRSRCVAGRALVRLAAKQAIWRLRNRLLVAYLFISLVPILLVATLALLGYSLVQPIRGLLSDQ